MKIVVIGSSNIDMVAQVSHLPAPGETVGDACFMQLLGGKGANQAVAAARLGASVTFITSLGNDMYADILKKQFEKEGIITDYIVDDECHPTGTALIFVADSGENCIARMFIAVLIKCLVLVLTISSDFTILPLYIKKPSQISI